MFPVRSETLELDPPNEKPDQYLWEARGNWGRSTDSQLFSQKPNWERVWLPIACYESVGEGDLEYFFSSYSGIRIYQSRSNDKTEVTYLARRSLGVSFMSSSKTCFMTPSGHSLLLFRSVIPCKLWNIWFLYQELTEIKRKIGMFSSWQSKT